MGKPATTYFCGKGHILEDNAHHCFGEYDLEIENAALERREQEKVDLPVCPHCGNKDIYTTMEWRNNDHPQDVPAMPIRYDEVEKTDFKGNKYVIQVPVYNMSHISPLIKRETAA